MATYTLRVNGKSVQVEVDPDTWQIGSSGGRS